MYFTINCNRVRVFIFILELLPITIEAMRYTSNEVCRNICTWCRSSFTFSFAGTFVSLIIVFVVTPVALEIWSSSIAFGI